MKFPEWGVGAFAVILGIVLYVWLRDDIAIGGKLLIAFLILVGAAQVGLSLIGRPRGDVRTPEERVRKKLHD